MLLEIFILFYFRAWELVYAVYLKLFETKLSNHLCIKGLFGLKGTLVFYFLF